MGKAWTMIAAGVLLAAGTAPAQAQEDTAAVDEATGSHFVPGSLERVATGYTFTEGPVWDGERLIFSDIPADTVHVMTPGAKENAPPPQVLYTPSAMANGHTFDREGRLLNAEHGSGAVTRWTPEGGRQVIVDAYEGKRLSSPNDIVARQADGMIFFTDPPYGLRTPYEGVQRENELGFSGVFGFDEASGRMVLIDAALERPNGLAFSPDERVLYVGDSATQTLWAYDITADGSAANRRLVADLTDKDKQGAVDGVRVDAEGIVYMTCPGGICVVDPARGVRLERLETPQRATNLAWGGADLSELYITAVSDLYRVTTRTRGVGSSSRR